MAARKPVHHCYELQGESLAAARALELIVAEAMQREQPQNSGNLVDIQQSWQQFYQRLLLRLEKENPELLQAVGLKQPSTVITENAGEFPRAYLAFAQIFASPHRQPRYFMYVPVDHHGKAFMPADARRVDAGEEAAVNDMLFAGGWLGNAPIFTLPRRGVALPQNVQPRPLAREFVKAAGQYLPAEINFLATGKTLRVVHEYEAALNNYNAKMTDAFDALRQATEKLFPAMLADMPTGEGLYVNLSGASQPVAGADTCLALSIRRDGKGGDFMAAGQPLPVPDNPYFKALPYRSGDYAVVTRSDTPQGRKLAKILLAIPAQRPALSDYAALRVNNVSPVLVTQGYYKVLRYFIDDVKKPLPPPGDALPFPPAALAWLRANHEDLMRGDIPPPAPHDLVRYLSTPIQKPGDSTKGMSGRVKKPAK